MLHALCDDDCNCMCTLLGNGACWTSEDCAAARPLTARCVQFRGACPAPDGGRVVVWGCVVCLPEMEQRSWDGVQAN